MCVAARPPVQDAALLVVPRKCNPTEKRDRQGSADATENRCALAYHERAKDPFTHGPSVLMYDISCTLLLLYSNKAVLFSVFQHWGFEKEYILVYQ